MEISHLKTTADKLRYYRRKKGLLQRDAAGYASLDRTTYGSYEKPGRDYYQPGKLKKIAELLEVKIDDLLDDYNTFLYHGQGAQVQVLRKNLRLTQKEFAKLYDVSKNTVKRWESGEIQISKKMWERLFDRDNK